MTWKTTRFSVHSLFKRSWALIFHSQLKISPFFSRSTLIKNNHHIWTFASPVTAINYYTFAHQEFFILWESLKFITFRIIFRSLSGKFLRNAFVMLNIFYHNLFALGWNEKRKVRRSNSDICFSNLSLEFLSLSLYFSLSLVCDEKRASTSVYQHGLLSIISSQKAPPKIFPISSFVVLSERKNFTKICQTSRVIVNYDLLHHGSEKKKNKMWDT